MLLKANRRLQAVILSAAKDLFASGQKRSFAALKVTSTCVLLLCNFHASGVSRRLMVTPGGQRRRRTLRPRQKTLSLVPSPGVPGEGTRVDTRSITAIFYENGSGVPPDAAQAVRWHRRPPTRAAPRLNRNWECWRKFK
jgi:hypothetical protein